MTAPTIELVDLGEGTPKYVIIETGQEPWIAQNIHEMLEEVEDFDSTDVFLFTPDMQMFPVLVDRLDPPSDQYWHVTLGTEPDGDLIEHVEYSDNQTDDTNRQTNVHETYVNGWPDPAN